MDRPLVEVETCERLGQAAGDGVEGVAAGGREVEADLGGGEVGAVVGRAEGGEERRSGAVEGDGGPGDEAALAVGDDVDGDAGVGVGWWLGSGRRGVRPAASRSPSVSAGV